MEKKNSYKTIKKIKVLFNSVLVRYELQEYDIYEKGSGIIIKEQGTPKDHLQVKAVGDMVRGVNVDDWVSVKWENFFVPTTKPSGMNVDGEKRKYRFTLAGKEIYFEGDDRPYYIISESDINYVLTDYTSVEEDIPESNGNIVLPANKKIIV